MKPPPFDYHDPTVLADALQVLAEHGRDIKILAGGQSLMQLLSFRLIRPHVLLDINRIAELHLLEQDAEGLKVGATVRQRELENFTGLGEINPLLAETLPWIGHFQTRNRGTVCGSLAHADPAAELPAVALTLDAKLTLERNGGQRVVPSRKFFKAALTTVLEPDEMLTRVAFPSWNYGDGWAMEQVARRPQDFALVGVVVMLTPADGACARARITVFGTGYPPARCEATESFLNGKAWSSSLLNEAVARVRTETKARSDAQATGEYRRYVAGTLAGRALVRAARRAGLIREGRDG